MKQQANGLLIYASDANDRFPLRDDWMDASKPYVRSDLIVRCPSATKGAYGYAFNGILSGARIPEDSEKAVLLFDSVNPIRNASDPVASLPSPGRHNGRNSVAYADGHAKGIKTP